jgi:hypothetical protein
MNLTEQNEIIIRIITCMEKMLNDLYQHATIGNTYADVTTELDSIKKQLAGGK